MKKTIEGYIHIDEVIKTTEDKLSNIRSGLIKPIRTSSRKEMSTIGGILPGEQIVLAGRTGTGKTAKMLHWLRDFTNPLLNPYYSDKLIVLYDTWEMAPWRNMLRLISRESKLTVKGILDYDRQLELEKFQRIIEIGRQFKGLPIYFNAISQTAVEWANNKRRVYERNLDKTIMNIVDHSRLVKKGKELSEEARITEFMIQGMGLKVECDMINLFLSQMNRAIETSVARADIGKATPVASDIFGADSAFQCADIVMALHRPGMYNLAEWEGYPTGKTADPDSVDNLLIQSLLKQRDGWTGNMTMKHNLALNEITDYD